MVFTNLPVKQLKCLFIISRKEKFFPRICPGPTVLSAHAVDGLSGYCLNFFLVGGRGSHKAIKSDLLSYTTIRAQNGTKNIGKFYNYPAKRHCLIMS